MNEFVDLHCHCVPGIDDGVRDFAEGQALLEGLSELGFSEVVATPHMRPGMFDNDAASIRTAFEALQARLPETGVPKLSLSCEHYFDDVVFQRITEDRALPYPGRRAILLEFYEIDFPRSIDALLAQIRRSGLVPVIAHPERYRVIRKSPEVLERLLETGAVALLDIAALVGKYGSSPQRCAEELLERDLYFAACTDSHRADDLPHVARAFERLVELYGKDELDSLLGQGPREILAGQVRL